MTVVRVTRLAPRDPVARPGAPSWFGVRGFREFLRVRGLGSSLSIQGFGAPEDFVLVAVRTKRLQSTLHVSSFSSLV